MTEKIRRLVVIPLIAGAAGCALILTVEFYTRQLKFAGPASTLALLLCILIAAIRVSAKEHPLTYKEAFLTAFLGSLVFTVGMVVYVNLFLGRMMNPGQTLLILLTVAAVMSALAAFIYRIYPDRKRSKPARGSGALDDPHSDI